MFGIGVGELLTILIVALLLFGPAVVVTWLVFTVVRASNGNGGDGGVDERSDPAMIVARKRFAAGEIDQEELEEIRRTLGY